MLFFGVFFEVGKEQITQLLRRRDLVPLTGGIKFRVAVAPAVIFFFGNLPCFQLGGNCTPCGKHPVKLRCVASFVDMNAQMHLILALADLKTVAVFQREQRVHVEQGERGSSEEHLTVTQFKVQQEQARLAELTEQNRQQEQQAAALGRQIEKIQNQQVDVAAIEKIEAKPIPFSNKVAVEREDFERLSALAKKYVTAKKKESKLQKALDAANRLIARLKAEINSLQQELSEYKSVRSKLRTSDLERENAELRGKVQRYEDVIQRNHLWHFFHLRREKVATRDDVR